MTSTSLRVEESEPPDDVVPQPVTVAVSPAYVDVSVVGRQIGLMRKLQRILLERIVKYST